MFCFGAPGQSEPARYLSPGHDRRRTSAVLHRRVLPSGTLAAVLALTLFWPPLAHAAKVSVSEPVPDQQTLSYEAAGGETNHVTITMDVDRALWLVMDTTATLTAGDGCTSADAHVATCLLSIYEARLVSVKLADMNDAASAAGACGYVDDSEVRTCAVRLEGGDGNDRLIGTSVVTSLLEGGDGNDYLFRGTSMDGGPGADTIDGCLRFYSCDPFGFAVYSDRVNPVFVSLNGLADDGEAGEGDFVRAVQGIGGGSAGDVLSGNVGPNIIFGLGGNDVLRAGGGSDLVLGGPGNDRIRGGPGRDQLGGNQGRDVFYARDGFRDRVSGGSGFDRARVDGLDIVMSIQALF
jgi:Ca2+-binding RTX toxin-like protein